MLALDSVIPRLLPFSVPTGWHGAIAKFLGFRAAERVCAEVPEAPGASIEQRVLDRLAVTCRVADRDLEQVPRRGAVLVVANHPFGILEGAVLATLLKGTRPDVRFLANDLLASIPEIRDLLIPVDPKGARSNARGLRNAIEFLAGGGCLVVFPAGEVSHYRWSERCVADSAWNTAMARMVEIVARRGVSVPTVPVYIHGGNSFLFHAAGVVHAGLRTALLVRELLNKRNRVVDVRIGSAIESRKLLEIPSAKERTEYLRWRTYLLANRAKYKTRTSLPLVAWPAVGRAEIAGATDVALMTAEVSRLVPLVTSGDLECYMARASEIPAVLGEIGRLREITFRGVGEGTGNAIDVDRFDAHYLHLFLWSSAKREIAGAYRLVATDTTRILYTSTLFEYGDEFLEKLGPAIELGRSFIRVEYQRGFAPLLLLWKGIGKFVADHPRYKTLFGPVSISNRYQSISRELMVTFFERHASLRGWMKLVACRNPLRRAKAKLPAAGFDVEELSNAISDLEPDQAGIPILLRQYLRLGGKLLAFNVDPEFANALDGLILVDLTQTDRKLLERYLGKAEATRFLTAQV